MERYLEQLSIHMSHSWLFCGSHTSGILWNRVYASQNTWHRLVNNKIRLGNICKGVHMYFTFRLYCVCDLVENGIL